MDVVIECPFRLAVDASLPVVSSAMAVPFASRLLGAVVAAGFVGLVSATAPAAGGTMAAAVVLLESRAGTVAICGEDASCAAVLRT